MIRIRCAALMLIIGATGTASAQQAGGSNVVDALASCRAVSDPDARLACFDKTAADLVAARDRKDVVVLDRAEVQKTRRSLFGFSLPRIKLFGGGDSDEPEDVREIQGTVRGVSQIAADRWQITLDDSTKWITTEGSRGFPPRGGESILIKRAALGSYDASIGKRRTIKVRRVG